MHRFRLHSSYKVLQGFTLLEVLVAMAISSFIYIGAYSLLDSVLRTDERISEKRIALEEVQRAFQMMQQDYEQILARSVRAGSEVGAAVEYKDFDKKIEFTRIGWRNPIQRPRSTMQRVSYFVEDNILYREHWLVLDRVSESEAKKNKLLDGVESMHFRFFDHVQNQWLDQWNKEPSDKQALPAAIEVTLKTNYFGDLVRVFRLVDNFEVPLNANRQ